MRMSKVVGKVASVQSERDGKWEKEGDKPF